MGMTSNSVVDHFDVWFEKQGLVTASRSFGKYGDLAYIARGTGGINTA
jgi:hypothetical protein